MYSFVADKDTTKKRDMGQIKGEVQSQVQFIHPAKHKLSFYRTYSSISIVDYTISVDVFTINDADYTNTDADFRIG